MANRIVDPGTLASSSSRVFLRRHGLSFGLLVVGWWIAGASIPLAGPAAPDLVHYQGFIRDDLGVPFEGSFDLAFGLFATEVGGTPSWTETHQGIEVTGGAFSIVLGSVSPLDPGLFNGEARWLEITPGGSFPLFPRHRFGSVPYAFRADVSDALVGASDTDWVISEAGVHRPNGSVGIGTGTPDADLHLLRDGDASIRIDADPANVDEGAQPSVTLTQDGGAIGANFGFFDGGNDFTVQRFSPGPDSTAITFLDSDNNVDINADILVGGGDTSGAGVSDGSSEAIFLRGESARWTIGVQNENLVEETDFFIGAGAAEDGTFHIERDGDIGIGTTAPQAKLEVVGAVRTDHAEAQLNLGPGSSPGPGGVYRDNVVYGWARVASDGNLIESLGFVDENVSGSETGEYVLTLMAQIVDGDACAVVTVQGASAGLATATVNTAPTTTISVTTYSYIIDIFTGEEGFVPFDREFFVIVTLRP